MSPRNRKRDRAGLAAIDAGTEPNSIKSQVRLPRCVAAGEDSRRGGERRVEGKDELSG